MMVKVTVMMAPPPPASPNRPRKTMSSGMLTDKPLISEPTAKSARPMKEHRLAAK